MIKSALAIYHWFVRHAVTGARVIARKPTGEEDELETPELASLEAQGCRLSPRELGLLAKKLANAKNPEHAARVRELITRGSMESDVRRRVLICPSDHEPCPGFVHYLPPALIQHLLERIRIAKSRLSA